MNGLKKIRYSHIEEARKYSTVAVAKAMGVSRPTYAKWEEHPESMTLDQASKLADYLGCKVSDFFYLPDEET